MQITAHIITAGDDSTLHFKLGPLTPLTCNQWHHVLNPLLTIQILVYSQTRSPPTPYDLNLMEMNMNCYSQLLLRMKKARADTDSYGHARTHGPPTYTKAHWETTQQVHFSRTSQRNAEMRSRPSRWRKDVDAVEGFLCTSSAASPSITAADRRWRPQALPHAPENPTIVIHPDRWGWVTCRRSHWPQCISPHTPSGAPLRAPPRGNNSLYYSAAPAASDRLR